MTAIKVLLSPIYLGAQLLDKIVTFLYPRADQIIAGSAEACDLTRHSNDDHFDLWELDLKSKETS